LLKFSLKTTLFNMEKDERTEKLKGIRDELILFKESPLYEYRAANDYFPVVGQGSHYAPIMFIGEAPGRNEAETGKPFCGAAGRILDELLDSIEIKREDVYVTNILKDRPPENRDPLPEEIEIYAPFLDRQIDIIRPKIIATLGRFSMAHIMKRYGLEEKLEPISKIHGKIFEINSLFGEKLTIIPLYHPAVAIYNISTKDMLKEDFKILKKFLE